MKDDVAKLIMKKVRAMCVSMVKSRKIHVTHDDIEDCVGDAILYIFESKRTVGKINRLSGTRKISGLIEPHVRKAVNKMRSEKRVKIVSLNKINQNELYT